MWHGIFPKSGTTRVTDPDGYEVKSHTTYVPYDTEGQTIHSTGQFKAFRRDENPASYGHDFNLIRAVSENGPQRIKQIDDRIDKLETELIELQSERNTLQRLIGALTP